MKSEVLGAFRNTVAIFALDFCFFVDYLEVDGWPTEFIDTGLFTTFVSFKYILIIYPLLDKSLASFCDNYLFGLNICLYSCAIRIS